MSVLNPLPRSNNLVMRSKEAEEILNNNLVVPFAFVHSTPLKREKITDLDVSDAESKRGDEDDNEGSMEDGITVLAAEKKDTGSVDVESSDPELVIARIYELPPNVKNSPVINGCVQHGSETPINYEVEVTEEEIADNFDEMTEPAWKSLEVLDDTAEYEFEKSLEKSKQYLSTSNLLEEIEADLPSKYSLARPLNHTFHSLASYRTVTRLARMDKNVTCLDDMKHDDDLDFQSPLKRLNRLETEAMIQQAKIKQAQKALIWSKSKKSMEVENLESEKTLLLANLRFSAACQELEKLKLLGDISEKDNFGQMTISGVHFSVEDTPKNALETFVCTATDRENVQVSSTMYRLDGKLCFDEPLKFQNLGKDFVIYIELFRRLVKETKTPIKACIVKKLKELAGASFQKTLRMSSSFNHGFECVACAQLRLEHITRRVNDKCGLYFAEAPKHPIRGETVTLKLTTDFNTRTQKCGFLNVFKSTWHRRWYSQSGHFLNSWLYPEDQENNKAPVDTIYLPLCTRKVEPADLEVCIRPHAFVLLEGPDGKETLFSADSSKDMMKWISHLNVIIENIRMWRPNV